MVGTARSIEITKDSYQVMPMLPEALVRCATISRQLGQGRLTPDHQRTASFDTQLPGKKK